MPTTSLRNGTAPIGSMLALRQQRKAAWPRQRRRNDYGRRPLGNAIRGDLDTFDRSAISDSAIDIAPLARCHVLRIARALSCRPENIRDRYLCCDLEKRIPSALDQGMHLHTSPLEVREVISPPISFIAMRIGVSSFLSASAFPLSPIWEEAISELFWRRSPKRDRTPTSRSSACLPPTR